MLPFPALDRLKADLDALRPLAPEQEQRVLQKFRLEWNYNSNAIEGNSLTLGETRSLLLHGLTAAGKPIRDHLDIKGHNEAVLALEDFVRSEYPLTEQFIREMHQLLLGEAYHTPAQTAGGQPTRKLIVPGRYKTSPNNVLTATGEMFYFASVEETPGRMMDLVGWYRQEEAAPTLHPVALAAEFHYRFVRIHPLDDGNGRMSRLLMNLILLRHGYPMTVIKAADRNRYLAALAAADAGEFEDFLQFIVENVEAGLRLMIRAAKGESIEEPDDLDKKLALLKVELLNQEQAPAGTWNIQKQRTIYEGMLRDWFDSLEKETERFDSFFEQKQFSSISFFGEKYSDSIEGNATFQPAKGNIATAMNLNLLSTGICVVFVWLNFKKYNSRFNVRVVVNFLFLLEKMTVTFDILDTMPTYYIDDERLAIFMSFEDKLRFDVRYDFHDTERIHEINHQLANKVYDFIAAKVAEADTPPA